MDALIGRMGSPQEGLDSAAGVFIGVELLEINIFCLLNLSVTGTMCRESYLSSFAFYPEC